MGEVITITGHSDDVVNIEGNRNGIDEAGDGASLIILGANDQSASAGVRVQMQYTRGVWAAAISPVQEDMPMLVTLVTMADNGYSVKVEVHGGVTLVQEATAEA
ncbi:MAG: hypothetical protein BWY85_00735 [Firmicutes bacterium ADurb.Bin506]|nr:MAG: hypothetical protein BWY85_00735 [Firmicutes bacterium ADurb.Bin506]